MKVFLLSTNTSLEPYPVYPQGMAMIASALSNAGHEVKQFDYLVSNESEELLGKEVLEFAPGVVGVSLRNIDNVDSFSDQSRWFLEQTRRIIDSLREITRAPIVVGGPAFSIMPEAILEYLGADFGVEGEGEAAVVKLLERIQNNGHGPRIVRSKEVLHKSQLCSPLVDKDILEYYNKESGLPGLQTKRGCPHSCVYCSYPSLEGPFLRARHPEEVVEDVAKLSRDHGVEHIFFTDSVFNDCRGHYLELALALARRNLPVRWSAFFRPDPIRDDDLDLLLHSGLLGMEVGSDSCAEPTLEGLGKGFCSSDVLRFNAACVRRGIPVAHYFIIGGPNETEATIRETLSNIGKLEDCVAFVYSGLRILPGTKLHAHAIKEGIVDESTSLLRPVYYHSPGIERDRMHEIAAKALDGCRNCFFPPQEAQDRMNVMRRFGYRGLIWDKLIEAEKKRTRRVQR